MSSAAASSVPSDPQDATAAPGVTDSKSSPPVATSAVAAAGKHNRYIWEKAAYFFGPNSVRTHSPGDAESAELVAAGAGVPPPSRLFWYARALIASLFILIASLALTNFVMLPANLLAFGWVTLGVIRQRAADKAGKGQTTLARWSPWVMRICELLTGWWQTMISAILERGYGMRVVLSGDVISEQQQGEGALLLSNHPCTADWVYLFSWLPRQGQPTRLKIVLKGSLHEAPVIGWALQCARYLFLSRNWEKDQSHMEQVVEHWAAVGAGLGELSRAAIGRPAVGEDGKVAPVQLLIFPEGTDLRPVSFDQSAAFLKKSQSTNAPLTPLQHLLQPRITGFVHLVKLLRRAGSVRAVYDLTLGSTPVPVTIENLARGVVPDSFHVHLRRFELDSLPQGDVELGQWLQQRWTEKDARLEQFYSAPSLQQRTFPRSAEQYALAERLVRPMQLAHFSTLFIFSLCFLLHSYALWCHPVLLGLAHAVAVGLWVGVTKKYGGFDALMLRVDQTYAQQKQAQTAAGKTAASANNKKAQ